jgi:hypothetical protein
MKKLNGKKLALHRETLATLSPDLLADVAGGANGVVNAVTNSIAVSMRVCPQSLRVCPPSRLACPPTLDPANQTILTGGITTGGKK